jgi:hypothetical protein
MKVRRRGRRLRAEYTAGEQKLWRHLRAKRFNRNFDELRGCEFSISIIDRRPERRSSRTPEPGTGFARAKLAEILRLRSRCWLRSG